MKTLHLSIIVFIIGISFALSNSAYGCNYCPMIPTYTNVSSTFTVSTNLENYTSSDKIMITTYVPSPDNNSSLAIKILGPGYNLVDLHIFSPDSNQVGYTWTVLPNGPLFYNSGNYTVLAQYGQNHAVTSFYLRSTQSLITMGNPSSPLQQIKSGIRVQDVKCNQGLQLIIKAEDGSPACVSPDTAQKLLERGWTKNPIGVSAFAKPSIGLYNVTASLQPIILGMSFFVNAEVTNNQNTPIIYYGGCISPLSVSFDNIQTHTDGAHCLAISKYVLGPHEQVSIQSDKINTVYNETGPDYANAELKFTYENNGTRASWFSSAEFTIQHAIKLDCTKPFQAQVEEINKSVDIQKAIALAYSSPELLSKVKQYGNMPYMGFNNDLFPDQSCNAYWKGVIVMFTPNDKNGARNIWVYEDINLTKVIKIEDFQAIAN